MLENYLKKSSDERLLEFMNSLSITNRTPEYYINWDKVEKNTKPYELQLNTLNFLLGKENIIELARELFLEQPKLLTAIPSLIASRDRKFPTLLVEDMDFSTEMLDFINPDTSKINDYMDFIEKSGLFDFMKNSLQKNLVDFVYGVEAGLDSNARKNRSGKTMEDLVFYFAEQSIKEVSDRYEIVEQASPLVIKQRWNIDVPVDKSNRRFDLAIFDLERQKLFLIETNYYGGGGSKLKAVSGEFSELNYFLSTAKDITFIWVTDGQGWHTAHLPLAEAFSKVDYIFNLDMLKNNYLADLLMGNF